MRLLKLLLSVLVYVSMHNFAAAGVVGIGTDGVLTTFSCFYTYAGDCKYVYNPAYPGQNLGSKSQTRNGYYGGLLSMYSNAQAIVTFDDRRLLPILRAYANDLGSGPALPNPNPSIYTGETGTFTDANVWAVGHYRYNGQRPTQLSISAYLNSLFTPKDLNGHSHMQIAVFTDDDYRFDVNGLCPLGIFIGCATDAVTLATLGMDFDPNSHNELTIYDSVKPGDEFYVIGYLDANVCCGGTVDTSHTMDMFFSDTSMLEMLPIAGASTIDAFEPEILSLTMIGLLALRIQHLRSGKNTNRRHRALLQ